MIETAARKLKQGPQVREGLIVESVDAFDYNVRRYGKTVEQIGKSAQFTVPVVVQRARILRTRAMFELPWSITATVDVDEELVDKTQLESWLDIGGRRIGLCDWRPEKIRSVWALRREDDQGAEIAAGLGGSWLVRAWHGLARPGLGFAERLGRARPGKAWPGEAWRGWARVFMAWLGKARRGLSGPGLARHGSDWPGRARVSWRGLVWCGRARLGGAGRGAGQAWQGIIGWAWVRLGKARMGQSWHGGAWIGRARDFSDGMA